MKSFLGFLCFVALSELCAAGAVGWPDPDCPYPQTDVFRFQYPGDCTKYYECYDGSKYVQTCPDGLEFNAPMMQCDIPEIANCDEDGKSTPPPDPNSTTEDDVITRDPLCPYPSDVATFFPNPDDCTTYFECFEGDKYLQHCPEDLYWSQTYQTCTYQDQADCGITTTNEPWTTSTDGPTDEPTDEPTNEPTDGPTDDPDYECPYNSDYIIYYPYKGDCNKYWECFAGEMTLMNCPPDLEWNTELEVCDFPENANCQY